MNADLNYFSAGFQTPAEIEELSLRTHVLWQFICAKAKRQQHGFICAKAKRQQQQQQQHSDVTGFERSS
ncbi:hypothetical protein [Lysinibacillus sp. NPDC059133]|uniref:hypothetical protein n=1 Tax=Lysinibacillus sp. NPDC059133 TaxID=3346737 RepID=UPI0036B4F91D